MESPPPRSYIIFRVLGIGAPGGGGSGGSSGSSSTTGVAGLELQVLTDPWGMALRKELQLCVLTPQA